MFRDSPAAEQLNEVTAGWRLPGLPVELKDRLRYSRNRYGDLCAWYSQKLESPEGLNSHKKDQNTLINWLYAFIRLNVIRGRVFDLRKVLQSGEADCLGYAKLFTTLGRQCGLDAGVVEIITDNRGRNVPHTCTLVRLDEGSRQFIDFWYGSRDIRHKRLGLQVKKQGAWTIEDIDFPEIKKEEDTGYLPDEAVDGITLYIEGNRWLKEGQYPRAIEQFTEAIRLYPQNARIYYNRAIGYEKMGQLEKAEADYSRALKDNSALKRTLATQPEDAADLIKLDAQCIPDMDQTIYLLRKGFITGRPVSPEKIALKLDIPRDEVEGVLGIMERGF